MSIIGSNVLAGASGGAGAADYQIQRSLRFNSSDSAYLSKTFASAGSATTWTLSFWIKRVKGGGTKSILMSYDGASIAEASYANITFNSSDQLVVGYAYAAYKTTNRVFKDFSSWYHILIRLETGNSTASDRVQIYVNGEKETSFASTNNPSLNQSLAWNKAYIHRFGSEYGQFYNDCYFADVHFVDGQALAPTDFGEFDDNNVWQPKEFSGTYGTNGFHLDFSDASSNAALGYDAAGSNDWTVNNLSVASGAGNDSLVDTPTNYGTDSGLGGEVRGNYCVINRLGQSTNTPTISDGNLQMVHGSSQATRLGTIGASSGKYYWEIVYTAATAFDGMVGVADQSHSLNTYVGATSGSWGYYYNGRSYHAASSSAYGSSYSTNDVISIALDMDNLAIYFAKNGVWQNSGDPTSGSSKTGAAYTNLSGTIFPAINGYGGTQVANWGQRPFAYTAPSGYKALCTQNLPEPTIADGSAYMDVLTWTGDGSSTRSLTGLGFNPDLAWLKSRSVNNDHNLFDSVRGVEKTLSSNLTSAEVNQPIHGYVTSFDSDGFSVAGGSLGDVNYASRTYVGWAWDAGANSSKTYAVTVVSDSGNKYRFDGHGTSAVTLDLEEGSTYVFDQSDSSNAGHPLRFSTTSDGTHGGGSEYTTGVTTVGTPGSAGASTTIVVASGAPTLYYYCSVHSGMGGQANTNSTAGASNFDGSIQATVRANPTAGFSVVTWTGTGTAGSVGHGLNSSPGMILLKNYGETADWRVWHKDLSNTATNYLELNKTSGSQSSSAIWGNTAPTSSVFNVATDGHSNSNGRGIVAYCFAPVEGYSAMGSFTGNGSTDGPFVYTGFRPAFIIMKNVVGNNWYIYDYKRGAEHNPTAEPLYPDASFSEGTNRPVDFLSNGVKIRYNQHINPSGVEVIYMAFAENPFSLNGGMAR